MIATLTIAARVSLSFLAVSASVVATGNSSPHVGDDAPALAIAEVAQGSQDVDLSWNALSGKVVILEFWATWCSPCLANSSHLSELAIAFADAPVCFVAISSEDLAIVKRVLERHPMKGWVVVLDDNRRTFDSYHVNAIPHTVVIDRAGKIAAITHPQHLTREAIQSVLAGRPAQIPNADSIVQSDATQPLFELTIREGVQAGYYVRGGLWHPKEGLYCAATTGPFDLRKVLGFAYDMPASRIKGAESLSTASSMTVRVPTKSKKLAQSMLRDALEASFGFEAAHTVEEIEVYELRYRQNSEDNGEPVAKQAGGSEITIGRDVLDVTNVDSNAIARALEQLLGIPVVDATGSPLLFDLHLEIDDTALDLDLQPLVAKVRHMLNEQAGLDLLPVVRMTEVLRIDASDGG